MNKQKNDEEFASILSKNKRKGERRRDRETIRFLYLLNGLVGGSSNTFVLLTNQVGLEESFRAAELLVSDRNDLSVGKSEVLVAFSAGGEELHFRVKVQSDVAKLLLDITDDFTFGGGAEGHSSFSENLHQVIRKVSSGKLE